MVGDTRRSSSPPPPPPMVDGLRQPSIRERLIPSASNGPNPFPIPREPRCTFPRRALGAGSQMPITALILELKPPSFANTIEPGGCCHLPLLIHDYARARAFKPLWEMTHRGSCRGILRPYIHNVCLREHFNVVYRDGCVARKVRRARARPMPYDVVWKFGGLFKS